MPGGGHEPGLGPPEAAEGITGQQAASGPHPDLATASPVVNAPILIAVFQSRDGVLVRGCSGVWGVLSAVYCQMAQKNKDLLTTTAKGQNAEGRWLGKAWAGPRELLYISATSLKFEVALNLKLP